MSSKRARYAASSFCAKAGEAGAGRRERRRRRRTGKDEGTEDVGLRIMVQLLDRVLPGL